MIHFKPLPEDIEQRLPLAAAYLRPHPWVVFAYLFGGLARGERRPLSDVDIAVYLAGIVTADVKLDILGKLIGILGTDVQTSQILDKKCLIPYTKCNTDKLLHGGVS